MFYKKQQDMSRNFLNFIVAATIVFFAILFSSCSEKDAIYYNGLPMKSNACAIQDRFGKYKAVKHAIYNWNFSDTIQFSRTKDDSVKIVFPAQTRVNGIEYAYKDLMFCDKMYYDTKNNFIDSSLHHYIVFSKDTLIDYVIVKTDTMGIKFYIKY